MTIDDLMAAPLVGPNRHALDVDDAMARIGVMFDPTEVRPVIGRAAPMEYEEYVIRYPRPTDDDLMENHAAGLPTMGQRIVRCRDCRWAREVPPIDEWHLECRYRPLCRHFTGDDDFCSRGEAR